MTILAVEEFQVALGLRFRDSTLLQEALTHRSYANENKIDKLPDNERLEFLGDAILDFETAEFLFRRFPDMTEGELTRLRSALVKTESLAQLGSELRLGDFVLVGKGEEQSGGRARLNILCRTFEALVGALYLDQGRQALQEFLLPRLEQLLDHILQENLHRDARSELQERSQSELGITPKYRIVDILGPDHEKEYLVEVIIEGKAIGRGSGGSKRIASQAAARDALQKIEQAGWPTA